MLKTIGLMSGTSLDGVDAAWIETDGTRIAALGAAETLEYGADLRADLRRLLDLAPTLAADDPFLHSCVARLTKVHVLATKAVIARMDDTPDLLGFHGQTILHRPTERRTWQVGDAALLAQATGVPVAHDFRSADVAVGGQGAPLVPVFHAALAADLEKPLAVLNLGGVGNVTFIGANGDLLAFDTGPGNGLLDDWAQRRMGMACDRDGVLSRAGTVDYDVLTRLMADPYFDKPGPKSLDRLDFSARLANSRVEALSTADGAATLAAFTAKSVAAACLPARPRRWIVCGGGRLNPTIMAELRLRLGVPVEVAEDYAWAGDAVEAQCFGFLAARVHAGLPLSFPGTTGVAHPLTGGRIVAAR